MKKIYIYISLLFSLVAFSQGPGGSCGTIASFCGDASVPFRFDIHAIIFSADAVSLEKQLHQELDKYRLNKVNTRKEFFSVSPTHVKELLAKLSTESISGLAVMQ